MVNITNKDINFKLLTTAIDSVQKGKLKWLLQMGFSEEQLKKINELTYAQLNQLANTQVMFLNFNLNTNVFDRLLKTTDDLKRHNKMRDKAIILGASNEILLKYFALTTTEVSTQRQLLNVHVTRGRVRKPNENECNEIWLKWNEMINCNPSLNLKDDLDKLDAYMIITESMALFQNESADCLSLTSIINELESSNY